MLERDKLRLSAGNYNALPLTDTDDVVANERRHRAELQRTNRVVDASLRETERALLDVLERLEQAEADIQALQAAIGGP